MNKTFGIDYASDIELDKYKLDDEAANQSSLVFYYADLVARAEKAMNESKRILKLLEAEKFLQYKEASDGRPPSDETVNRKVEMDKEVQNEKVKYFEAVDEYNTKKAMLDAVNTKGFSINTLKDLYVAKFWSARQ